MVLKEILIIEQWLIEQKIVMNHDFISASPKSETTIEYIVLRIDSPDFYLDCFLLLLKKSDYFNKTSTKKTRECTVLIM